MDPVAKAITVRCRAAILTVERQLEKRRYRRWMLTDVQKREAIEVRAFRLGQQFRNYGDDPFANWHHPLAGQLSKSYWLGAGECHRQTA